MSDKERNAVENVVRGRQPVLVALPVKHTSRHTHTHAHTHTHPSHTHTLAHRNTFVTLNWLRWS